MDAATRRRVRQRFSGIAIVGLTAIGRATARLLKMNSENRLKVRAALRERDELDA